MISRAFEMLLKHKNIKLPVEVLPHINENIIPSLKDCKKFNDYVTKIDKAEQGIEVKKIIILHV